MTIILDGFEVSKAIRNDLKERVIQLKDDGKRVPCLAVVIVGNDPASQTYVASKQKQCHAIGYDSRVIEHDENISMESLLQTIHKLNNDNHVDGILVQLPLPKHLNEQRIIESINPNKDVDGLHPLNLGYLEINEPHFISCTPKGILRLLDWYHIDLEGKEVLVIGRSRLVGKPVATLFTHRNATVTLAHSRTRNLEEHVNKADIVIVAIGKPEFIPASWFRSDHIVVDVGIHRIDGKIVGDVDRTVYETVAYATPVPKGIGPMTIASLLENTLIAYEREEHHDDC